MPSSSSSSVSPILRPPAASGISWPDQYVYASSTLGNRFGLDAATLAANTTTYTTIFSSTAPGVLEFLSFDNAGGGSQLNNLDVKITIDNRVVMESIGNDLQTTNWEVVVGSAASYGTIGDGGITFSAIPFDSITVEYKNNDATQAGTCRYRYRLTA